MPHADIRDLIKRRAYALWEEEGRPEGRAEEHWFRAEAEVIGANAGGEAGPARPARACMSARHARGPGAVVGAGASDAAARVASSKLPNPDAPGRQPRRSRSKPAEPEFAMTDKPERTGPAGQQQGTEMMAPGDEAPPGTPGTGEDVCPSCGGSGRVDGRDCDNCLGRGRIIKAISAGA